MQPYRYLALTMLGAAMLLGQSGPVDTSQTISIREKLQIPSTELKPGTYQFSVEDRLPDRAIIRIGDTTSRKYTLLLAVPNAQLAERAGNHLIFFATSKSDKQVLRGWACPACAAALEFVYPKSEAAAITKVTTDPVIAVDPSYDNLPTNLSPDDMKVVTLWLLTPKPVAARDQSQGVIASKFRPDVNTTLSAQSSTPQAESDQTPLPTSGASASTSSGIAKGDLGRSHLPKTASNAFNMLLGGIILLLLGSALHFANARRADPKPHV